MHFSQLRTFISNSLRFYIGRGRCELSPAAIRVSIETGRGPGMDVRDRPAEYPEKTPGVISGSIQRK
jgi:hypothetical protein